MSTGSIKVLIADDIPAVCRRLAQILQKDNEISEVLTASSGYHAIAQAFGHRPDVVLMDINMETNTAGIDAAKAISDELPDVKIITLTVYEENRIVYEAYQAGVIDYLLKDSSPETVLAAVKAAYNDLSPIRPRIAKKLRDEIKNEKHKEESLRLYIDIITRCTSSELEVLKLICHGKSRREICELRCVEESTAKTQIRSILRKLNAKDSREVLEKIRVSRVLDLIESGQLQG